jgi:hypothetical protein
VVRWREADVDRNGDDIVSSDEAAHAWIESFHQLDQDGNDQLSQDELKQMQAQIYEILAKRSGRPLRQIIRDTKRTDFYLDARRALDYGLIDGILEG